MKIDPAMTPGSASGNSTVRKVCFGVAPIVIASGASAKSQQALGTVVMGGMIALVILALLMVPVFFVVVRRWFHGSERQRKLYAHELDAGTPQAPPTVAEERR